MHTYVKRSNALLVLVVRVELARVEKFLDGSNLTKSRQLHDILFNRYRWLDRSHLLQLYLTVWSNNSSICNMGSCGCGSGRARSGHSDRIGVLVGLEIVAATT